MPTVQISGAIPSSMAENSRNGDWAATLAVSGSFGSLVSVSTIGVDAAFIAPAWDPVLRLVRLTPGAAIDAEALTAAGRPLEISFGLRFRYADGTTQDTAADAWRVSVLDRDDSPPERLFFASGGSVAADALGAVVGTLGVLDRDSVGPFHFTLLDDEWRFFIDDGGVLRLHSGVNLGLDAVGVLPLIVTASDGFNAASFTLEINVRDALDPAPVGGLVLGRGEERAGFAYGAGDTVLVLRGADEVAITPVSSSIRQVDVPGGDVWLGTVGRLRLAEGFVEYASEGTAMRAAALRAVLDADPDPDARRLGRDVTALEGGLGLADFAESLLPGTPAEDATFITALFEGALGRAPDGTELVLALGRLEAGFSRAQLAVDVVLGPAAMARFAGAHADGLWVFQPLGDVAAIDPGLPGALTAPVLAADLFLV